MWRKVSLVWRRKSTVNPFPWYAFIVPPTIGIGIWMCRSDIFSKFLPTVTIGLVIWYTYAAKFTLSPFRCLLIISSRCSSQFLFVITVLGDNSSFNSSVKLSHSSFVSGRIPRTALARAISPVIVHRCTFRFAMIKFYLKETKKKIFNHFTAMDLYCSQSLLAQAEGSRIGCLCPKAIPCLP